MKRVIITGPTGAIGVALIQELILHDIEVIAVARPGSKRKENIPKDKLVRVIECGLNQLYKLPRWVDKPCDIFYHLGWDGTFGNSIICGDNY